MKKTVAMITALAGAAIFSFGFADTPDLQKPLQPLSEGSIQLSYSNGLAPTYGVRNINAVLRTIGVSVGTLPLPDEAAHLLKASQTRALTAPEADALLSIFSLSRSDLLNEVKKAGRVPAVENGGLLSTSEVGVPPYPKVYDMQALSPETVVYLQEKFGRLHVNSTDAGVGIDEVMTIVSGGPYTWFFVLPDNVVGKLTLGRVGEGGHAWRISYPGRVPHGGYFDAEYGLVVAHAHGPRHFVMRYEDPRVKGAETLGTNPWIDFSQNAPQLLGNR